MQLKHHTATINYVYKDFFRYTIYNSMHLFHKIKEKIEKSIFIILIP